MIGGWPKGLALSAAALLASACPTRAPQERPASGQDGAGAGTARSVTIIMVGDGMGRGQLEAASLYAHGSVDTLSIHSLPVRAEVATASVSGITDSAASATAMATGTVTQNGRIGMNRHNAEVENLTELARANGLATGVVTTTEVTHATPASFVAHSGSRYEAEVIAAQMASGFGPDVIFGGGSAHFTARADDVDLVDLLASEGYAIARTAGDLASVREHSPERALGLFASGHLPYVLDREPDGDVPDLVDMSMTAIEILDQNPRGFLLMIEGGRIDHAGHANDLERNVHETIEFDDAVRAVADWARERPYVTLLVTADHETGGLRITGDNGPGELPEVTWRWTQHTNDPTALFASGPLTDAIDGQLTDHRWVHALAAARIRGDEFGPPPRVLIPNGYLNDLRGASAAQEIETNFGVGYNQLDYMSLDADRYGLNIGVEGLFEWQHNAIVILLDTDFGLGTGLRRFDGSLADQAGAADELLSQLRIDEPDAIGWGADVALVTIGGADPKLSQKWDDAGLRVLSGATAGDGLSRGNAVFNFAGDARVYERPRTTVRDRGLEVYVPWSSLFADGAPARSGARFAVLALLVSDSGTTLSNQALPSFDDRDLAIGRLPRPLVFEMPGRGENIYPWLLTGR